MVKVNCKYSTQKYTVLLNQYEWIEMFLVASHKTKKYK